MSELLDERYQVLSPLGAGAFGCVVRALDRETQRVVAIKRSAQVERLRREYEVLCEVRHPAVVEALGFHGGAGEAALVMALVEGEDFVRAARVDAAVAPEPPGPRRNLPVAFGYPMQCEGVSAYRDCGPAGHRRLRRWVASVAGALRAVHAAGYLHLDVRRDNVRVDREPVLLDLGLAHARGVPLEGGAIVGSPTYLAPELATGCATEASDAYSLGVLLFEALTGRPPFEGGGPEVLVAKQSLSAPSPRELVRTVPEDLDRVCVGLLARSPSRRLSLAAL